MTLIVGENTYATSAEADAYFTTRLDAAAWTAATEAQRNQALQEAFRALEALRYVGAPFVAAQTAQWPRTGILSPNGNLLPAGVIPPFLIAAQCEEALALLELEADPAHVLRETLRRQGVTATAVGDVREQYGNIPCTAGLFSPRAYARIRPYLLRAPARVWSGL